MPRIRIVTVSVSFVVAALCTLLQAGELRENTSMRWVPDSVAMYVAGFRMEQQWEMFEQSNAYGKLKSIPLVQMGLMQIQQKWNSADGDLAEFKAFIEAPENAGLVQLARELFSTEFFICGDQRIGDLIYALNKANQAGSMGQLKRLSGEGDGSGDEEQLELIINAVRESEVPNLVMGFHVADSDNALAQLGRLEKLLKSELEDEPEISGRLNRIGVEGGDFLQFTIDAEMIPWEKALEDEDLEEEQVEAFRSALQGKTMYVNLGVIKGYVYLGMTSSSDPIELFQSEDLLIDSKPFKKVREVEGKEVTSVSYVSGDFLRAVSRPKEDLRQAAELGKAVMGQTDLEEDLVAEIKADLDALIADVTELIPEQGTIVAVEYLTDSGYEGFQQSWAENKYLDASKPLRLLQHVGQPLMVCAARSVVPEDASQKTMKWVKRGAYYAQRFASESDDVDEAQLALVTDFAERLAPFGDRWMKITETHMKTAMSDGESAFVVDSQIEPKTKWHPLMPEGAKPLPLLEFASLTSVTDADSLEKGMMAYVDVANEALAELKALLQDHSKELAEQLEGQAQMVPHLIQGIELPTPVRTDVEGGRLYHLTMLQQMVGVDAALAPCLGWSEEVMAVSLSPDTVKRCLQRAGEPAASLFRERADQPLAAAMHIDIAGMIDRIKPWLDYGLNIAAEENAMILMFSPQIDTLFEVAGCFKTHTSVTYSEDESLVTFYRTHLQDLE